MNLEQLKDAAVKWAALAREYMKARPQWFDVLNSIKAARTSSSAEAEEQVKAIQEWASLSAEAPPAVRDALLELVRGLCALPPAEREDAASQVITIIYQQKEAQQKEAQQKEAQRERP